MKNALIDPRVNIYDPSNPATILGVRVCDVETNSFEVAEPLFWVACEDNITPMGYAYNAPNFVAIVYPAPTPKA